MSSIIISDANKILLPTTIGHWQAVYWEPVPATAERICIGCITEINGIFSAHRFVQDDLLQAMYGKNAGKAIGMAEKILNTSRLVAQANGFANTTSVFSSAYFGEVETLHCHSQDELVRAALLMSSSLGALSEPASLQAEDVAEENTTVNRQFITRIRDRVTKQRPDLAMYFNRETVLKSNKSSVKFGFLSEQLVAHIGLLPITQLARQVRNARGLMAEVKFARDARDGEGNAIVILGISAISSPTLNDKQRYALEGAIEELRLESADYGLSFSTAESDQEGSEALLALA